ncbi:hypothetical protein L2E82_30348 [Cichorium intybus]|uniref:Uncharacterized protein n=1 Tax=Cichorium intybus TaxID=13427 RepID=A0ACB9D046_CICIN|nr:hypothetical protein L2E82_30348 [Cichorium intybus]
MVAFNIQEALIWKEKFESVIYQHQQSLVANQNKYHSFKYKSGMDSGRNDPSSDQESQYTAAENEEDSRPSLMRRTTIGDGPFESILDWTQESSTLATQNTNNHVFSTKHLRLLQCQNGLCIFEELLEFDFLEVPGMGSTSLNQDESDIDPNDQNSILEHLDNVVNSLIEKCGRKDSTNSETMLPLIRVKVDYSGFMTINLQRFGQKYVGKVKSFWKQVIDNIQLFVSGLPNLTELSLKRNNITAKRMSALSGFVNLLKLDLERCPLIRGGFEIYFL